MTKKTRSRRQITMLPSVGKPDARRAAELLAPIILAMLARERAKLKEGPDKQGK